jgi:hypothetical protein
MPLAVSHLSFCFGVGLTAILLVQLLELSDFSAKISDLFTKHCEMIHGNRIAHLKQFFKRYQENGGGEVWFPFLRIVARKLGAVQPAQESPRGPVLEEIPSRCRSGQAPR